MAKLSIHLCYIILFLIASTLGGFWAGYQAETMAQKSYDKGYRIGVAKGAEEPSVKACTSWFFGKERKIADDLAYACKTGGYKK